MGLSNRLLLGLALVGILACAREENTPVTEDIRADVSASPLPAKAAIGSDGKFTWADGDRIAVWYASSTYQFSHYYEARLVSGAGTGTAVFRVEKNGERTGYALYPFDIADNKYPGLDAHRLRVVLPDEYRLFDGMPSPQPLVAENVAGSDLAFYHLASLLRMTLSNIPAGTRSLRVVCDKDICGPFRVTFPSGSGQHPYLETGESSDQGNHHSVLFTYDTALGSSQSAVLDVPLPQGVYSYFRVEALSDDKSSVLSAASSAEIRSFLRADKQELSFDLSGGASRLSSFSLSEITTSLLPGQYYPVNASVRQVRAGGGTENASGYRLEAASVSDPGVVELFVRDNAVRVRGLAPGKATILVKAVKGDDTLYAETEVRVSSIDGVSVCVDNGEAFTDWFKIIPAQVVSEGRDVTSDDLFTYEWELQPAGTTLATLEGEGSEVILRTGTTEGTVTVVCTVKCKSAPSISFTSRGDVSFTKAVGIKKSPFSVSATEQVYFAAGNLLQDNTTHQYFLCPSQTYAFLGVENLTLPPTTARRRDMFNNEVCTDFSSPYTSKPIVVDGEETYGWEALSKAEVDYLLTARTTAAGRASRIGRLANARYILAEVDGREGLMIFPDVFFWPKELPAPDRVNAGVSPTTNRYTLAEWEKYLDSAGAVFLVGGLFGPITYSSGSSMRFDYNHICYRTRDYGYFFFRLYSEPKYNYNSTIPEHHDDYRYMRVRPVKRIYK